MAPYSVVLSVTAPDMQMVVVPAMSTSATTAVAKVSFTVLPPGDCTAKCTTERLDCSQLGVVPGSAKTCFAQDLFLSLGQCCRPLNFILAALR